MGEGRRGAGEGVLPPILKGGWGDLDLILVDEFILIMSSVFDHALTWGREPSRLTSINTVDSRPGQLPHLSSPGHNSGQVH